MVDNKIFERIAQKLNPHNKLLRAWKLEGGISAQVMALEIKRPDGQLSKLLVRQHGAVDLAHNPRIAADEFRLLQFLQAAGVAAPEPYLFDESGEILSTSYVVIEYIEGKSEFAPAHLPDFLAQFAAHLASIHQFDCSKLDVSFLPQLAERYTRKLNERPAKLDESLNEDRIRAVLEAAWPPSQRNPAGLLHGDYWPGNLLWRDGQLIGVIDWEDAALGDPLSDLANSRLEILWAFGREAMLLFTQQYQSIMNLNLTGLPYWDLCAALRPISKASEWAEWAAGEQVMREGHQWFVEQALSSLE